MAVLPVIYTDRNYGPAPLTTGKRQAAVTYSPTSSATTKGSSLVAPAGAWLVPEAQAITGGNAVIPAEPAPLSAGWVLPDIIESAVAGTWTIPVTYLRNAPAGGGNIGCVFTAVLLVVDDGLTATSQELGRQATAALSATTTEQVVNIPVSCPAFTLNPNQRVFLQVWCAITGLQLITTLVLFPTNDLNHLRISSAPAYTPRSSGGGGGTTVRPVFASFGQ